MEYGQKKSTTTGYSAESQSFPNDQSKGTQLSAPLPTPTLTAATVHHPLGYRVSPGILSRGATEYPVVAANRE